MKSADKLKKKLFDEKVDKLYSQFCDLITAYQQEREVSKSLEKLKMEITGEFETKKNEYLQIYQDELQRNHEIREELDNIIARGDSFDPSEDLNNQLITAFSEKNQLQSYIEDIDARIANLEAEKQSLEKNKRLNSMDTQQGVLTRYSKLKGRGVPVTSASQTLKKRDHLRVILSDLKASYASEKKRLREEKIANENATRQIEEDAYNLKNYTANYNKLSTNCNKLKRHARELNKSLGQIQADFSSKDRMVSILKKKNQKLKRQVQEAEDEKEEYEELVSENLQLKEQIKMLENLVELSNTEV